MSPVRGEVLSAWGQGPTIQSALSRLRRPSVLAQTIEVAKGVGDVKIVPATHIERGCGDFVPAILIVDRVPVLIIVGVFDPIFPEGTIAPCRFIQSTDGQAAKRLGPVMEFDALPGAAVRSSIR